MAAKDNLVAIVLYEAESGPAYVQLAKFRLNGKHEVSVCGDGDLNRSRYHRLPKIHLAAGMVMERTDGGKITVSGVSPQGCVVPMGLKLKKRSYTAKELADSARLSGTSVAKSGNAGAPIPSSFQAGMQIHLLTKGNTELAEYLLAMYANSIPLLQAYAGQYPNSSYAKPALQRTAQLLVNQGETELETYTKSVPGNTRRYDALKAARTRQVQVLQIAPEFAPGQKLKAAVDEQVQLIVNRSQSELEAFLHSMTEHTPGFEHLQNARLWLDNAVAVDAAFPGIAETESRIAEQRRKYDQAMEDAENMLGAGRQDEALKRIQAYRHYAGTVERVAKIVDAVFQAHYSLGKQAAAAAETEKAIAEFKAALAVKPDPAAQQLLNNALQDQKTVQDRNAAGAAVENARAQYKAKQYMEGYSLLETLTSDQQKLVQAEMSEMLPDYVRELRKEAYELVRLHRPVRGPLDEQMLRQAHDNLVRVVKAEDKPADKIKLGMVRYDLAQYYATLSQHLLEKPGGTGVGLGLVLLKEGQFFNPRDENIGQQITKYAPQFELRAKFSASVYLRDLTNSPGFAAQLTETTVSELERSNLPGIKVLAPGASQMELPNLAMVENIVQHRLEKKVDSQVVKSHYRTGQREVKTPEWLETKRQVDTMQEEYDAAIQTMLTHKSHRKRRLAALQDLSVKLNEAKKKLAGIPESRMEDIVMEYSYTRRTFELTPRVEISFRIDDPITGKQGRVETVQVADTKTYAVNENVKDTDMDGAESGVPPGEDQLLRAAESKAQSMLIEKLTARLRQAPGQIFLQQARDLRGQKDMEGAAEKYLLYLNSSAKGATPERVEARGFLLEQFDIHYGL
jgi:hypothetical protein